MRTIRLFSSASWPVLSVFHARLESDRLACISRARRSGHRGRISDSDRVECRPKSRVSNRREMANDDTWFGTLKPSHLRRSAFLLTAVAKAGRAELKVGAGGEPTAADDNDEQTWLVLCYDKHTGKELWQHVAHQGKPRATRHAKATHANTSLCVDGENVVAFLGSEGLHCYDMQGTLRWKRDLGVINISKYGIGWGFASSPSIHRDRIALVCDDPRDPYVTMRRLNNGEEIWRASRKDICERSWGTPCVLSDENGTQVVVNGWPWIVSYDFETGNEVWRSRAAATIQFRLHSNSRQYLHHERSWSRLAHFCGAVPSPRRFDFGESNAASSGARNAVDRTCPHLSHTVITCTLGIRTESYVVSTRSREEKIFRAAFGNEASIIASLVAGDGKVCCASENGVVYVLATGPDFKILASNPMGEPCFATPAISEGILFIRTTDRVVAIESDK